MTNDPLCILSENINKICKSFGNSYKNIEAFGKLFWSVLQQGQIHCTVSLHKSGIRKAIFWSVTTYIRKKLSSHCSVTAQIENSSVSTEISTASDSNPVEHQIFRPNLKNKLLNIIRRINMSRTEVKTSIHTLMKKLIMIKKK